MKPVKNPHDPQGGLFKTELVRIIGMNHPLVRLGNEVAWERLNEHFGETYCEDQVNAILSAAGMNFGKLLKAASRLPLRIRTAFAHLIGAFELALRPLRSKNPRPDRPDQIMALV
jgi:hypothetical protein